MPHAVTAAAQSSEPLRHIVFGSCLDTHEHPMLDRTLTLPRDLFIFMGDNVYADKGGLPMLRDKYALLKQSRFFQELRAKGAMIAKNLEDLHSEHANINKQTALTEKGEAVPGRGDQVNMHDILTGSDPQGRFSTAGGDTTCGNWTKSGEGSAIVGHHDRQGLKDAWHMKSWNSSHGSRGCSQDQLKASGGAGLLYCFVPN